MEVGLALHSDDLKASGGALLRYPVLELEDYLFPGFADRDQERLPEIQAALAGYLGARLVSAPYVDLNPASPDRLVVAAARQRFHQAQAFALALGASEVICLSTFLPFIDLSFYEEDWEARSLTFWRSFLEEVDPALTFSLGNVFEFTPNRLARLVERVGRPNFRLAFDFGHFLVYGRAPLEEWAERAGPLCSTVYVHSNDGRADTHDPPGSGRLRGEDLARFATAVPPQARLIAKMNDKATAPQSIAWIRKYVSP